MSSRLRQDGPPFVAAPCDSPSPLEWLDGTHPSQQDTFLPEEKRAKSPNSAAASTSTPSGIDVEST